MPTLATVAAFGFPDLDPVRLLPLYHRLGCETVQFYRNVKNPPTVVDVKRIVGDAGLRVDSIHGVFGAEYDPTCPDEVVRRSAVETYRREGEYALELGGPLVVVHPGPAVAAVVGVGQSEEELTARRGQLDKTMVELAAIGEELGVVYVIENLPSGYCYGTDPVELAGQIREFGHEKVRMCFDLAHAHITSDVRKSLAPCVDVLGYMHITDNDGEKDLHQIPGAGNLPFDEVAEVFRGMRDELVTMLELFEKAEAIEAAIESGLGERLVEWLGV